MAKIGEYKLKSADEVFLNYFSKEEITNLDNMTVLRIYWAIINAQKDAIETAAEAATASMSQETVNGGKVAKVNKESILNLLK